MIPCYSFSIPAPQIQPPAEVPQPSAREQQHVALEKVVRPMLTTAQAAYYLQAADVAYMGVHG